MKKNKKTQKKLEDKLILVTRIVGGALFLLGVSIIIITSIIKSSKTVSESFKIEFKVASDNFILFEDENNILNKEYIILKSMDDYNQLVNDIEKWNNNLLLNNITPSDELINEPNNDYEAIVTNRNNQIKDLLNNINVTEKTFVNKAIIVIEDLTTYEILECSKITDVYVNPSNLGINIEKTTFGNSNEKASTLYFIEIDKQYAIEDINVKISNINNTDPQIAYKPIIYIYPTKEQNVEVTLGHKENLIISYPEYNESWNILAKQDGTLIDNKTNRELYSLYYEANNSIDFKVENYGFVISKDETIQFLEEKLKILGLNPKEQEEFIIYWLPILNQNNYNYIRFATIEEINKNIPLQIEPQPETIIRILMTYKGLDKKINVKEQPLQKVERKGYTIVEWGGTQIQ